MKKILIVVLIIVLAIIGGLVFFLTNIDSIVKGAIEKYGSQVTATTVRVDRVKIDLRNASGGIHGLTVASPMGFSQKQAFSLGETSVKIDVKNSSKKLVVLDNVTVRNPHVNYEMNAAREGNLNALYDNVRKSIPAGSPESKKSAEGEPKIIIRKFVFQGGSIDALIVPAGNKTYSVKLPPLTMNNLGAPKGASGGQIAKEILSRITKDAQDQVQHEIIDKQLKGVIEQQRKQVEGQAQQQIESQKQKAQEKLKEMLKQ